MVKQGFSLVEIIIVIAIIAVLAAATFGGFRYLQKAKVTTTENKANALMMMIDEYNSKIGEYPTEITELVNGPSKANLQKRWGGVAIAHEDDLMDAWHQQFVYTPNPKGTRPAFDLYSIGPKGESQIRPRGLTE